MYFSELSSFAQSFVGMLFLGLLVYGGYQAHLTYQMKIDRHIFYTIMAEVILDGCCYIFLVLYYSVEFGKVAPSPMAKRMEFQFPCYYAGVCLFLMMIAMLLSHVWISHWRKRHTTQLSLKDAMDNLRDGMCFFTEEGVPLLQNRVMQDLSKKMTGTIILNADHFLKVLEQGQFRSGFRKLPRTKDLMVQDKEGNIWKFTKETLPADLVLNEELYQLLAENVTESWKMNALLQEENKKLRIMNERLEDYRVNLDETVKADELLTMRLRVHDDLGQMLLATRRYLSAEEEEKGDLKPLLNEWRNLIHMLYEEDGVRVENDPVQVLQMAAESLGLELRVEGEFPTKSRLLHLMMSGARESMTNAAHKNARVFTMQVERDGQWLIVTYSNDGEPPIYPVTEGGGLGSLRRLLESEGSHLEIAGKDPFYIRIRIPDRRENR